MNIPITKEQSERLEKACKQSFVYGSRLFKVNDENSDYDIIKLYHYFDVFIHNVYWLPNIHSFQFTDTEHNVDIIYSTYQQFFNSLHSGDGTMFADIVLFSDFLDKETAYNMCRTYKVIKGYCGTVKRDLKSKNITDKIIRRSAKNLYIAESLINKERPTIEKIQDLYKQTFDINELLEKENNLRDKANSMLNSHELLNYYIPKTNDDLLDIMLGSNNLKEYIFKK